MKINKWDQVKLDNNMYYKLKEIINIVKTYGLGENIVK